MKICEISHFFCYESYRKKAVEVSKYTNEKELLIVPKGWMEDFHNSKIEESKNNGYILKEKKAFFNWKIFGGKRVHLFIISPTVIFDILKFKPDIILVDSELYSLLSLEITIIRNIFFRKKKLIIGTSQNIYKKYPFPFNFFELYVLKSANLIFSRTNEIKQVILKKNENFKVKIIPHGVDLGLFNPNGKIHNYDKELKIAYIGSLIVQKDVSTLVKAISLIRKEIKLFIIGNGPEKNSLENLVCELSLSNNITFMKSIPNLELPKTLNKIDAIVLPSITMPNWKEQFGRVIIEAMACGVPVIGSSSGSIPDIIGDGGVIYSEGNANELKLVIENIDSDRDYLKKLSDNALIRVKNNFSWQQVAAQIYNSYTEIMN